MALHFIISPIPCSSEMAPVQGSLHLNEELQKVVAHTQYGDVFGGRAHTGAAVWLGKLSFLCIMISQACD